MQQCVLMFNFLSQCELCVTICVLLCWPATVRASLHHNGRLLFNKQKTSHFPARFFFCLAFDLWCRALTGPEAECCVAIKVKLRVLELCSFPLFSSFFKAISLPWLSSAPTVKVLLSTALNCCCFVAQLAGGSFQKHFAFFAHRKRNWDGGFVRSVLTDNISCLTWNKLNELECCTSVDKPY